MAPRVCHISYEYPPHIYGGLGRHVGELTAALARHGWQVDVTSLVPPVGDQTAASGGVTVHGVDHVAVIGDGSRWLDAVAAFDRAALRGAAPAAAAADVLHVHDWFAANTAMTLRQRYALPLILTVHATERGRHQGWLPGPINRFVDEQERRLAEAADAIIVCSAWMRDALVQWWGLDTECISVVPNGVAVTRDVPSEHRRAGVLFAGRCEHEKGGHVLLQAMSLLRRRGVEASLTVAGEGSQRHAWGQLADELGIAADVTFVGRLGDAALADAYRRAAAIAVPSLYEPFGLVAVEAMAAGAPVVAAATGGLIETVANGGVLVEPGDPIALADALVPLLTRDKAVQEASQRSRRRAADLPSWDEVAGQVDLIYTRLLRSHARTLAD